MSVATSYQAHAPSLSAERDRLLTAARCRLSLYEFVKHFWHIIEPDHPFIDGWHVKAICDHLQGVTEGKFSNLIICLPPGFAKSTLVSVMWFCWTWAVYPSYRMLYGSYDEELTFRDSDKCRDIIKSQEYIDLFDIEWRIVSSTDKKSFFKNSSNGNRKTYYMTSRKKTGWRGEFLVIDDPLSAEDRYDKNIKAQVIDTWDSTLWSRINRAGRSGRVIIMQRLSDDDLVGHIMSKPNHKYVCLIMPNEFDPKNRCVTPIFQDPRTEEGELLCPQIMSAEDTEDAKLSLGVVDYIAQYQHNPVPLGGDRFQSRYFQYWSTTVTNYIIQLNHRHADGSISKEFHRIDRLPRLITCDVAADEKKRSDFTCLGLWAITDKHDLILLHRMLIKEDKTGIISAMRSLYDMQQWGRVPPMYIAIEDNGLGLPIAQNAQNSGLPIKKVHMHKDLLVMSATASVRIQGGQIFFPDYDVAPWMHEFVKELLSFPRGAHDDQVSMLSLAANDVFEQTTTSPRNVTTIPDKSQPKKSADLSKNGWLGVPTQSSDARGRIVGGVQAGTGMNGTNGNGTSRKNM